MLNTLAPRSPTAEEMANFRFYYYEPSMPAAIIFVVLFALATLLHTYQMIRSKTWFMWPFVVGGILEIGGYVGRVLSAQENPGPYGKYPYIVQSLLLLVAPPLFAASIYMELGRIVLMVNGEKKLFIRRTWLTRIFVLGDVASFFAQAAGSGMLASKDIDKINLGHWIVIAGLFVQIIFFGMFVIAAAVFHFRLGRSPTTMALKRPWKKHIICLYIVSGLIFLRSIVRCVEFIQGYDGYVNGHELFLYIFDAVPMFLAVLTMNIIHPGEVASYIRAMKEGGDKGDYREIHGQNEAV